MKLVRPGIAVVTVALALAIPLGTGAAATTSGVQSTGSVAGTVTGVNGTAVVHACVQLYMYGPVVYTDAQGAYLFSNVSPSQIDPYHVIIDASCSTSPNAANYFKYTTAGAHVVAGQTAIQNAALTLGGSISGHVQMGGNPVAGACINAIGEGAQGGQTQSASDGSYTVTGISPGDYSVEFLPCSGNASPTNIQSTYFGQQADGSPTTVTVTVGNQVALGNQTVVPGGEIDIKLTDALGNILSTDTFPQAWLMDKSFLGPSMGTSRQPDVNGYWHLLGLRPQAYEIEYGYCGPTCRRGLIGYYAGQGVRGTPTPVVPVAGGPATVLTDVVTIPTESTSATSLTVSPAAPTAGQTVTITATVTDPQTGAIPTGSMWFLSQNLEPWLAGSGSWW